MKPIKGRGPNPPETGSSEASRISSLTLFRASLYLRCLGELENQGKETVSSKELADKFSISSALVRKDLGLFGEFGKAGIGYGVKSLKDALLNELGLKRVWKVAIIGAGRLGLALARHKRLAQSSFKIAAIFDKYPEKTIAGRDSGLEVLRVGDLPRVARERGIELGIIAVPGASAQEAADAIVQAGLKAILNFAPTHINVPKGIFVHNVDFTIYLENLAYYVNEAYHQDGNSDRRGGRD